MKANETAIVVVDVWNRPECPSVFERLEAILPAMEDCLLQARDKGVTIIHAPTGTMHAYEGTPARDRMQTIPRCASGSYSSAQFREPPWGRTGGCECNPERECKQDKKLWGQALTQHPALTVTDEDFIIDDHNDELFRVCTRLRITNLYYVGQALNMCIFARSLGMAVMKTRGFNVIYSRDLTIAIAHSEITPYWAMRTVQRHMDREFGRGWDSREFLGALE